MYQRKALGFSYKKIATNLGVDISTAWRIVKQFQHTGSVTKKQYNRDNLPRKVNHTIELIVLHVVLEHPGIYLREIQSKVQYLTGLSLSLSTICHLLHQQHFSRKKMKMVARQRDELTRATYAAEVALYDPDMFIFLDETGSDRRNALRKYGYSLRGIPAVSHKLLIRGEHLSTIACISMEGILEFQTVKSSVDGDIFLIGWSQHSMAQEKQADQDRHLSWPGPVAGGWGYDPYYCQSFPYSQYWQNHPAGPYPPPDAQRCQNYELESLSPHSPPSTPKGYDSPVRSHSSSPISDIDAGCNKPEYSGNKQVSMISVGII